MDDFRNMYLENNSPNKIYIDYHYQSLNEMNIIFCCTPICSVIEFRKCYEPFIHFGFNVFAIDFSGVGQSDGEMEHFSVNSVMDNFECLVKYIRSLNDHPIFMFGDTGIGGIFAQYFISITNEISAFAQFGNAVYRNMSPLKCPNWLVNIIYPILGVTSRLFPALNVPFSIPKYSGYNEDKDNNFYVEQKKRNPKIFHVNINLIQALMYMLWDKKSSIRSNIVIPTLVFKTLYDRYFSSEYFDEYYENLKCIKKMIVIEDVHNSYFFYPDLFAREVADWYVDNVDKKTKLDG